jgi:hypothetical protein
LEPHEKIYDYFSPSTSDIAQAFLEDPYVALRFCDPINAISDHNRFQTLANWQPRQGSHWLRQFLRILAAAARLPNNSEGLNGIYI